MLHLTVHEPGDHPVRCVITEIHRFRGGTIGGAVEFGYGTNTTNDTQYLTYGAHIPPHSDPRSVQASDPARWAAARFMSYLRCIKSSQLFRS